MPVNPTYPGVYIEELPSNNRTVTPAPTSLTVFVGYTHPFKTNNYAVAVRLFSFADYEREFGGFFTNAVFSAEAGKFGSVAHAVYQFFLNGGSDCYVVGLQAKLLKGNTSKSIDNPTGSLALKAAGKAIAFKGLEPTEDPATVTNPLQLVVTVSNVRQTVSANDTADLVITYGTRVETYRSVNLTGKASTDAVIKSNYIENRINKISHLVEIDPPGDTTFDPAVTSVTLSFSPDTTGGFTSIFNAPDFDNVFQADSDLDKVAVFNLLVLPGVVDAGVQSAAIAFCERKLAFFIMDPDSTKDPTNIDGYMSTAPKSPNGALYFPYLQSFDPSTGVLMEVPPSGVIAGMCARIDVKRGVWKAPAGLETTVLNTVGVVKSGNMNDPRQGVLNNLGINCLRTFPNIGTVVFGSRTLVADNPAFQQFKYVPVRRMTLFIEQTLLQNLTWATFEPNDVPLWTALRLTVENFMLGLFTNGALQGTKPSEAFRVICDKTTTTADDVAKGIVNIVVLFAPLRPAEFVIAQVGLLAGQVQT